MKKEQFFDLDQKELSQLVSALGLAAYSGGQATLTAEQCGFVLECINNRPTADTVAATDLPTH